MGEQKSNATWGPLYPLVRKCGSCGHPQSRHWNGLGACDTGTMISGNSKVFVCSCKKFRIPNSEICAKTHSSEVPDYSK